MGVTTSTSNPRGDNEVTHGIYNASLYHWTPGQIAMNIQSKIVTPTYLPNRERSEANSCMCLICYLWFPSINETRCCQHPICTECLACIIKPPPENRVCPICQRENLTVRPNVGSKELARLPSSEDNQQPVIGEPQLDDFHALLLQFPDIDPETVWSLFQAGVSIKDIAISVGLSLS
jgi:hypothetical protein